MIEVNGLTKRYGDTVVLDDVSTTISTGGVVALIGPNGAGKSTLISAIGRLLPIDGGTITIDGLDLSTTSSDVIARRLAILRQDNQMAVRLTVKELVEFGRFPHAGTRLGPDDHEKVGWALDRLDLQLLANRRLDQISGGQRQRAFIAMVLCQDTDYVLLDEPLNNLDMRHAVHTMALVRSLADDLNKTVVVVLHDVNVAAGFADRILAISEGVVVADGSPAQVINEKTIAAIYGIQVPVRVVDGQRVVMSFNRPTYEGAIYR